MKFTKEHREILDRSRRYYESLKSNGTMSNISSVTVLNFERIYNEAIGPKVFSKWCPACIIELIELVYINYDKFLTDERTSSEARKDVAISEPKDKGKEVHPAGTRGGNK